MKRKRFCHRDSAGTYSTVEGPSPPAKSTNIVSPAPPIAAFASTVPTSQLVTCWFAPELASSQAAFTPNTTSEALLTQQAWQDQMNLMSINTKTVPDRVKLQLHAPLYILSQFDVH